MILDKNIKITVTPNNVNYLKTIKNNIKIKDIIEIPIEYLSKTSKLKINVQCDECKTQKFISYYSYNRNIKSTNVYTCQKCSIFKNKITNLKKYGVEYPLQSNEIKEKRKKNNLEKYGVDEPAKLESVISKMKQTKLLKYGDENYNNKNKSKETKLLKYNDENYNNRAKSNETCTEKYGVINPSQLDYVKNKKTQTFIKNYNSDNYKKSDIYKTNNLNFLLLKYENINILSIDDNKIKLKCDCGINHNYEIEIHQLRNRIIYETTLCTICNPINSYSKSGYEIQLSEFIELNYNKEIILNSRNIISPLELDIYLPELKIAFEFNGLFWHSEANKENNYHLNKTEECEKQNVQLIHIYEDDWIYKQDIVKSIIISKLNQNNNIINSDECEIKEISDNKLIKDFLNTNHIQGFIISKVKIGLYYNNELVSIIIFSSTSKSNEFELLRFCNKLNTNIIDSSNKLFNYFIDNYNPFKITTYVDRSYNQIELTETLGFIYQEKIKPKYYYVLDRKRNNKNKFKKNILIEQGFDKNKTEHEIMLERKIYRIYDSGNLKFIYNNKKTINDNSNLRHKL